VEQVEEQLRLAVERRLADAQRPATFLSGGVDSSLICALAAPSQPKITALTVGFEGDRYDETPVAARVAKHLGLDHVVWRYGQADYLQAFAEFQRGAEQPVADPAVPPTLLAFRDCRQRFDVVLDGSGADEAAGLAPPRHARIATQYAARLPHGLRRRLAGSLRRLPILAGYAPVFDFEHPAELAIRWRGFRSAEIEALCGEPVCLAHTRFYRTFDAFPRHAHFQRHSALLDAMPGDRLHQGALQTGLTLRFPFWDRTADAYIRALPVDWRYRPGAPKRILRAILARHVPSTIWDLPKHGFDFPLQGLLQSEGYALVRRYLDPDLWRPWQVLPAGAVAAYARRYMAGEGELAFRVWTLAVLAAWLETHAPARADAPATGLDQAPALV
jgi:asparagine synthase (glutamine-hydrolysing)